VGEASAGSEAGPDGSPDAARSPGTAGFFAARGDRPGLALFLNAGDPPLPVLPDVPRMLDDERVDALELAVPFPDSVTDGPAVRASADRALAAGVGLAETLDAVAAVRPSLGHLRIALFADWGHTVRTRGPDAFAAEVRAAGADAALVHAVAPRVRPACDEALAAAGLPVVTTCYASSAPEVLAEAAARPSAYLYLVATYGRSGSAPAAGFGPLAGTVASLRAAATAPVAVGFGVRTAADVAAVAGLGADAAVVGTAVVACVERALTDRRDVVAELRDLVRTLRPEPSPTPSAHRGAIR
jgi:tryptophan synthase alpha chain